MLVFELIKNKLINICKMIKPADAGKTPSLKYNMSLKSNVFNGEKKNF